jgi:spore maturation protein CgeB
MRLTVFGLTVTSSWGNGHATLWRALIRALHRDGHRVVFFERDAPYYARHRDLTELPGCEVILYPDWDSVLNRAHQALHECDVAMVTSYCPDGVAATYLVRNSSAPLKTFYDLDTPVTLERLERGLEVAYLGEEGLRGFDLVLSYTGGAALTELQRQLGAGRVAPLYGSVDPSAHRPVEPVDDLRCEFSYLGTYAADRQDALERLFLAPARQRKDLRFIIGGALYPAEFPWSSNLWYREHVPPPQHPAFFSSCRLTLNITRAAMARMGYCPSGRLFEAAACGAPMVSDHWEGLEAFFTPGREILIARDTPDVLEALALGGGELARLRETARDRVLSEHTAAHRARELIALLEEASGPTRGSAPAEGFTPNAETS